MSATYKLAVLSDIHGNLPALEAVLADLENHAPLDGVIVAGDIIGGPGQEAVVQRLRAVNALMTLGNWDQRIVTIEQGSAPAHFYTASQFALVRWVRQHLSAETLAFLAGLPQQRVLRLPGADPIRIVHGSPRHIAEKVYPQPPELLDEVLALVTEPVVVFGHTHTQWQARRGGRLALSPGSIFTPHDVIGAQYALLCWDGAAWEVFPKSVAFPVEEVRAAYQESGFLSLGPLPRIFLHTLATGQHIEQRFMQHAREKAAAAGYPNGPYIPDAVWDALLDDFSFETEP